MDEITRKIRLRAQELCRTHLPNSLKGISERNETIIEILMDEFDLSHEDAEYHFKNNKKSE